jgi:SPX domain protein involved in polyphosphate accumulation
MKFNQRLQNELVPEWKAKYVDYKQLKKLVKAIREEVLSIVQSYADIKRKHITKYRCNMECRNYREGDTY